MPKGLVVTALDLYKDLPAEDLSRLPQGIAENAAELQSFASGQILRAGLSAEPAVLANRIRSAIRALSQPAPAKK